MVIFCYILHSINGVLKIVSERPGVHSARKIHSVLCDEMNEILIILIRIL